MLLEKSQELIELSERKIVLRKNVDNVKAFESRAEQITNIVNEVQFIVEAVKTFREKGINNFSLEQKLDSLLEFIVSAENNFYKDSSWIVDNKNFNYNFLKKGVDAIKANLEQQLSINWQTYLAQNMPSTNNEMLNLLSRVQAFSYTVQNIRRLDSQIKQIDYPKNNHEFELAEKRITELKHCWESLHSDDVPKAVLDLLRAAANQGASLSMLTPEVLDWVNTYGIADSLKIRLS
jgi:hypothetical protein